MKRLIGEAATPPPSQGNSRGLGERRIGRGRTVPNALARGKTKDALVSCRAAATASFRSWFRSGQAAIKGRVISAVNSAATCTAAAPLIARSKGLGGIFADRLSRGTAAAEDFDLAYGK